VEKSFSESFQSIFLTLAVTVLIAIPRHSWAWGKQGHHFISAIAAHLLSDQENRHFVGDHVFDFAYYSNVPDVIWRNMGEEINKIEGPLHFIDWEDYAGFFSYKNLPSSFAAVKKVMGDAYKRTSGLSPWRIQQMHMRCASTAEQIRQNEGKTKSQIQSLQGELLVCMGVLSHYMGDLSMPLHVSRNYDGQLTGQKGVHAFFESTLVDYLGYGIYEDAEKLALKKWKTFSAQKEELDTFQLAMDQVAMSQRRVAELLKIDKGLDQKDLKRSALKFRPMIVEQISQGALYVAQAWKKFSKKLTFDEQQFYFFSGAPAYIQPDFEGE